MHYSTEKLNPLAMYDLPSSTSRKARSRAREHVWRFLSSVLFHAVAEEKPLQDCKLTTGYGFNEINEQISQQGMHKMLRF